MALKQCKYCGKNFAPTKKGQAVCSECLAAARATTIRPRTCRQCGTIFDGGPRAWYCPSCRAERRKEADLRRRKNGVQRPLGSTDHCEACGKEYVVKAARQRYCPECAQDATKEAAKKAALERSHTEKFLKQRKLFPQSGMRVCVICGRPINAKTNTITCSPECQKKRMILAQQEADIQRGKRKSPSTIQRLDEKEPQKPEENRVTVCLRRFLNQSGEKTGVKGVSFHPDGQLAGTYSAWVTVMRVQWAADGFPSLQDAIKAREDARNKLLRELGLTDRYHQDIAAKNAADTGKKQGTVWHIRSPEGEKIRVYSMMGWAKENAEKFKMRPTEHDALVITGGFTNIKRSYLGKRTIPNCLFYVVAYKGWYLDGWEDDYGELYSTCGPPVRGEVQKRKEEEYRAFVGEKCKQNETARQIKNEIYRKNYYQEKKKATGGKWMRSAIEEFPDVFGDTPWKLEPASKKNMTRKTAPKKAVVRIKSPSGKIFTTKNMSAWIRENCQRLFGREPTPQAVKSMITRFSMAKTGKIHDAYGWTVLPPEDDG